MDGLNYMGILVMLYFYTFAFVGSQLLGSGAYFAFLSLLVLVLAVNIALIQYDIGRNITFYASLVLLLLIYLYDFFFHSSPKQKQVFYIPMMIELILLLAGYLLYFFSLPERWCRGSKFIQLYVTGFLFFTLFLINFYFEAQRILYFTIKLNSGYYDDVEDDWWKTYNVYQKND